MGSAFFELRPCFGINAENVLGKQITDGFLGFGGCVDYYYPAIENSSWQSLYIMFVKSIINNFLHNVQTEIVPVRLLGACKNIKKRRVLWSVMTFFD